MQQLQACFTQLLHFFHQLQAVPFYSLPCFRTRHTPHTKYLVGDNPSLVSHLHSPPALSPSPAGKLRRVPNRRLFNSGTARAGLPPHPLLRFRPRFSLDRPTLARSHACTLLCPPYRQAAKGAQAAGFSFRGGSGGGGDGKEGPDLAQYLSARADAEERQAAAGQADADEDPEDPGAQEMDDTDDNPEEDDYYQGEHFDDDEGYDDDDGGGGGDDAYY